MQTKEHSTKPVLLPTTLAEPKWHTVSNISPIIEQFYHGLLQQAGCQLVSATAQRMPVGIKVGEKQLFAFHASLKKTLCLALHPGTGQLCQCSVVATEVANFFAIDWQDQTSYTIVAEADSVRRQCDYYYYLAVLTTAVQLLGASHTLCLERIKARRVFGRPIEQFFDVQKKLVHLSQTMHSLQTSIRQLEGYLSAKLIDHKRLSQVLYFAMMQVFDDFLPAMTDAVFIHGAYGYMHHSEIGKLWQLAQQFSAINVLHDEVLARLINLELEASDATK